MQDSDTSFALVSGLMCNFVYQVVSLSLLRIACHVQCLVCEAPPTHQCLHNTSFKTSSVPIKIKLTNAVCRTISFHVLTATCWSSSGDGLDCVHPRSQALFPTPPGGRGREKSLGTRMDCVLCVGDR